MGRKPSFTTEDYADRIIAYLHNNPDMEVTTREIIRDVKGTNYRLADGLFLLALKNKVRPVFHAKGPTRWTLL